jgi:polar amino acid transport system substrate-binding protein
MPRFLLALILAVAIQAPDAVLAEPTISSEIAPAGKLRAAMIGANPVLVKKNPDGSLVGVAPALGKFIAGKLGLAFEPVLYADAASYSRSFGTGAWDVAIGFRRASEAHLADYSPDFIAVVHRFVAAPGREFADAGAADRTGVRIAVIRDGAADRHLTRALKSAALVRIPFGPDAAAAVLREGRADLYGSNAEIVEAVAARLPGAKLVPGEFHSQPMAVALPKGRSPAAQARLAELVQEARRAGLIEKALAEAGVKGVRIALD